MKRFLAAAILCLVFVANGRAQQTAVDAPATKEDVQKYLDAIHSHDMIQKMLDAMSAPMHQMIHDQYMKNRDVLPADYETKMNHMMDDLMKGMPFDEMIQAMIPAYQAHFTKGDIDAMIAFYSTATGQKVLREMPAIVSESMSTLMPIVQQHMDGINEHLQQEIAEILKQSQSKSGGAESPSN